MTLPEFEIQFNRLSGHFHLPTDGSRETIAVDWFKALQHLHVDAFDAAVTELIKTAQDRFWPALGKVLALVQSRFDKYQRTDGKCGTCHGSTWIESAPFKSNGMIYSGVCVRCPDCGHPQPAYNAPSNRQGLTAREYAEFRLNDHNKQYMPEEQRAKHPNSGNPELKAAYAKLRIKLFGATSAEEVA